MKTIYHVDHINTKSEVVKSFKTEKFVEVAPKVKEFVQDIKEGEEVEYWKEGNKFSYEIMLTYVKKHGKIMMEIIKGAKIFYKESTQFM